MALPEISWEFTVVLIHHHTMRPFEKYSPKLPTYKNADTSTICQWNMQGGKRAATATCSDISLTWWQTRFRWVPENLVLIIIFFLFFTIFLVIIVLFSWRLAEAVVFLKAGGGGNMRFASFFNWLTGNSKKYQIQNRYQIDYQTKILRKQLTVMSPVDDTGDLNLLGEVTIWIHWHHHHHYHHHNCQYHYKSDPHTRPHSLNDRLTDSATQLS